MFPDASNVTINDGTFTEIYVDQSMHFHLCSVEAPQSEVEIGSRRPSAGTRRNELDAAIRALISVLQDGEGDNETQAATFSSNERGRKQPQLYTHPKTNSSDTKEKLENSTNPWPTILEFLADPGYGAYFLESLLPGGLIWKCRRLIFKVPVSFVRLQVSLFLSRGDILADVDEDDMSDRSVVWQAFGIGGARQEFAVHIPFTPGTGNVSLAFGTVDGYAWEHEGGPAAAKLARENLKALESKLTATGGNGYRKRIAVGTYDDENLKIQPFLLVGQLPRGGVYEAPEDLYLHAFRSNGYSSGQYGKTLFKDVVGDRLTPEGGFKLSKLSPLTSWYIKSDRDGKLTLKIGRNSRKDVKAYRHECRVGKDAIAKV